MPIDAPKIPDGMVELMRGLSKSMLKEKPDNLIEFAANYFDNLLKKRDGSLHKGYEKFESLSKCRRYTKYGKILHDTSGKRKTEIQSIDYDDSAVKKPTKIPSPANKKIQLYDNEIYDDENLSKEKIRKRSSKIPTKNLKVITEETSVEIKNEKMVLYQAAVIKIQKAVRQYLKRKHGTKQVNPIVLKDSDGKLTEDAAAIILQKLFKNVARKKIAQKKNVPDTKSSKLIEQNSEIKNLEAAENINALKNISVIDGQQDSILNENKKQGQEGNNEMAINNQMMSAVLLIQKVFRGYLVRKDVDSKKKFREEASNNNNIAAALLIQKYFRGYKARKEFQKKKEKVINKKPPMSAELNTVHNISLEPNEQTIAAVVLIQKIFRGYKERKRLQVHKENKNLKKDIATKDLNKIHQESATTIQKTYRGYKTRENMKIKTAESSVEQIEPNEQTITAVILIQKMFRGYKARKYLQAKSLHKKIAKVPLQDDLNKIHKESATAILGYKTREDVKTKKGKPSTTGTKDSIEIEPEVLAPDTKVQMIIPDNGKHNVDQTPSAINKSDDFDESATKIQKTYRGYKTRKDLKNKPETSSVLPVTTISNNGTTTNVIQEASASTEDSNQTAPVLEKEAKEKTIEQENKNKKSDHERTEMIKAKNSQESATTIQKTYRGYKTRKDLKNKPETSSVLPVTNSILTNDKDVLQEASASTVDSNQTPPLAKNDAKEKISEQENENKKGDHDLTAIINKSKDYEESATTIQKTYRGYRTRKELENKPESPLVLPVTDTISNNGTIEKKVIQDASASTADSDRLASVVENDAKKKMIVEDHADQKDDQVLTSTKKTNDPQESATTIQKTYRGYKTRKDLQNKPNNPSVIPVNETKTNNGTIAKNEVKEAIAFAADSDKLASVVENDAKKKMIVEDHADQKEDQVLTSTKKTKDPQESATTIQKTYRGYKARKDLQNKPDSASVMPVIQTKINNGTIEKNEAQEASASTTDSHKVASVVENDAKDKIIVEDDGDQKDDQILTSTKKTKDPQESATTIQKTYRGYKTRKDLQNKPNNASVMPVNETKTNNGTIAKNEVKEAIASAADSNKVASVVENDAKEKMVVEDDADHKDDQVLTSTKKTKDPQESATTIQKTYRGYKTRKDLQNKPNNPSVIPVNETKTNNETIAKNEVKEAIASAADSNKVASVVENDAKEKIIIEDDGDQKDDRVLTATQRTKDPQESATTIQKTYRGYKTRKDLKNIPDTTFLKPVNTKTIDKNEVPEAVASTEHSNKTTSVVESDATNKIIEQKKVDTNGDHDLTAINKPKDHQESATTIQKTYRGYKTRKELKNKPKSPSVLTVANTISNSGTIEKKKLQEVSASTAGSNKVASVVENDAKEKVIVEDDADQKDDQVLTSTKKTKDPQESATTIQKTYRGYKTRKDLQNKPNNPSVMPVIETKINNGTIAKNEVKEAASAADSNKVASVVENDAKEKMVVEDDGDQKDDQILTSTKKTKDPQESATTIQKTYRGYKTRKDLQNKPNNASVMPVNETKTNNGTIAKNEVKEAIASAADSNKVASVVENDAKEKMVVEDDADQKDDQVLTSTKKTKDPQESATTIQKTYRGYKTRKDLQNKPNNPSVIPVNETKTNNETIAKNEVKEAIASAADSNKVASVVENDAKEKMIVEDDGDQKDDKVLTSTKKTKDPQESATTIQKTYRGYKTRKDLQNKPNTPSVMPVNETKTNNGTITKNEVKEAIASAADSIKVASVVENDAKEKMIVEDDGDQKDDQVLTSTKKTKDPQESATTIQKTYRGYKTRKVLQNKPNTPSVMPVVETKINNGTIEKKEGQEASTTTEDSNKVASVIENDAKEKMMVEDHADQKDDQVLTSTKKTNDPQESATTIQKTYRGYKTRKDLQNKPNNPSVIPVNETKTNNGTIAKNEVKEAIAFAADSIKVASVVENDAKEKMIVEDDGDQKDDKVLTSTKKTKDPQESATTIQKTYRGYKTRKDLQNKPNTPSVMPVIETKINNGTIEKNEVKEASALTADSNKGVSVVENDAKEKIIVKDKADKKVDRAVTATKKTKDRQESATTIQKTYRGYKTRKGLKNMPDTPSEILVTETNSNIGTIDKSYVRVISPSTEVSNKIASVVEDDPKEKMIVKDNADKKEDSVLTSTKIPQDPQESATVIQKTYRGYKTRKDLKYKTDIAAKIRSNEVTMDKNDRDKNSSSTPVIEDINKIGSVISVVTNPIDKINVQEVIQKKIDHIPVHKVSDQQESATIIQKMYRGYKARRDLKNKREALSDLPNEKNSVVNNLTIADVVTKIQNLEPNIEPQKASGSSVPPITTHDQAVVSNELNENDISAKMIETDGSLVDGRNLNENERENIDRNKELAALTRNHERKKRNVDGNPVVENIDEDSLSQSTINAAINIQKIFRGYKVRQNLKKGVTKDLNSLKSPLTDIAEPTDNLDDSDVIANTEGETERKEVVEEVAKKKFVSKLTHLLLEASQIEDSSGEIKSNLNDDSHSVQNENETLGNQTRDENEIEFDESEIIYPSIPQDELSELENVDISVYSEDSLEAMYYSLKKNEMVLDKMHRRASQEKSLENFIEDVENDQTNDSLGDASLDLFDSLKKDDLPSISSITSKQDDDSLTTQTDSITNEEKTVIYSKDIDNSKDGNKNARNDDEATTSVEGIEIELDQNKKTENNTNLPNVEVQKKIDDFVDSSDSKKDKFVSDVKATVTETGSDIINSVIGVKDQIVKDLTNSTDAIKDAMISDTSDEVKSSEDVFDVRSRFGDSDDNDEDVVVRFETMKKKQLSNLSSKRSESDSDDVVFGNIGNKIGAFEFFDRNVDSDNDDVIIGNIGTEKQNRPKLQKTDSDDVVLKQLSFDNSHELEKISEVKGIDIPKPSPHKVMKMYEDDDIKSDSSPNQLSMYNLMSTTQDVFKGIFDERDKVGELPILDINKEREPGDGASVNSETDNRFDSVLDGIDETNEQEKILEIFSLEYENSLTDNFSAFGESIDNPMAYAKKRADDFLSQIHRTRGLNSSSGEADNEESTKDNSSSSGEKVSGYLESYSEATEEEDVVKELTIQMPSGKKFIKSELSEADSDYYDLGKHKASHDDFNISTALEQYASTDSDSTINSAATKIQAGARGFLTRRRIRGSISERPSSFGNAAIDQSLDDMIEENEKRINITEGGAKSEIPHKISHRKKFAERDETIREDTIDGSRDSFDENQLRGITEVKLQKKIEKKSNLSSTPDSGNESTNSSEENNQNDFKILENEKSFDANNDVSDQELKNKHLPSINFDEYDTAARRMTLHRGDAVQGNSTPEDEEFILLSLKNKEKSKEKSDEKVDQIVKVENLNSNVKVETLIPNVEVEVVKKDVIINSKQPVPKTRLRRQSMVYRGRTLGVRQRTMPVQIDSEVMRTVPKHLRKRVKSAENLKKIE